MIQSLQEILCVIIGHEWHYSPFEPPPDQFWRESFFTSYGEEKLLEVKPAYYYCKRCSRIRHDISLYWELVDRQETVLPLAPEWATSVVYVFPQGSLALFDEDGVTVNFTEVGKNVDKADAEEIALMLNSLT